jgi:hypothetical protein
MYNKYATVWQINFHLYYLLLICFNNTYTYLLSYNGSINQILRSRHVAGNTWLHTFPYKLRNGKCIYRLLLFLTWHKFLYNWFIHQDLLCYVFKKERDRESVFKNGSVTLNVWEEQAVTTLLTLQKICTKYANRYSITSMYSTWLWSVVWPDISRYFLHAPTEDGR